MIGTLDGDEIEQLLRRQYIGRLGVSGLGHVFIFPVAYGYDGTYLYIHSHAGRYGGLKVGLMRANPEVCLEVEEIVSPLQWRTVLAHGTFEELTDPAERDTALAAIVAQADRSAPLSVAPYVGGAEEIVLYRIRVTQKTGRYERDAVFAAPTAAGPA